MARSSPPGPPHSSKRCRLAATLLFLLLLTPVAARPQGCSQCRDNTAATPPSTRRAYRHAIALLALTAGGIFAGTVLLLRRHR